MDENKENFQNEYRKYLLQGLLDASQRFYSDFKKKELSEALAPMRFRAMENAGAVLNDLWEEVASKESFEQGCLSVIEKYLPEVKIYRPINDGVDHINIYSRGRTELGRVLSNFSRSPFEHPQYGRFMSVEAFWYYIKTGCIHYKELAHLYGPKVKSVGRKFEVVGHPDFEFQVELALWCKVMQNPHVKELLQASTLPLTHYYYYGNVENPAIRRVKNELLQNVYEKIRKYLNKVRSSKKKTLVVLDAKFSDYAFINDMTTTGLRYYVQSPKHELTFCRQGSRKYADEHALKMRNGETLVDSADLQQLFELSLEHDKVYYLGGRSCQESQDIIQTLEVTGMKVSNIGRF